MDKRLAAILADIFSLNESDIHPGITRDDVDNWDSLKQMDLVLSLEREYDISLEMRDIVEMTSVESILSVLKKKEIKIEN